MTPTERRGVWEERVKEWKESGLTAREYAVGRGFSHRTLQDWKYRLGQAEGRETDRENIGPSFVEIGVREADSDRMELIVNEKLRIRVSVYCEPGALVRMISALEAR